MGNALLREKKALIGTSAVNTDILTDWLTVEQASVVAGVPIATVLFWIRTGQVRAYYFGPESETVQ